MVINNKTIELATWLHDTLCTYDHTEQCGWEYEHNWSQYTHAKYADLANELLNINNNIDVSEHAFTITKSIDIVKLIIQNKGE